MSDDKPAHVLEIPDSLGRDVDKARAGTLKAELPIEAFMSETSLAEAEANSAAASAPVYAEDLIPISAAAAASRVVFDGEHLPKAPSSRRVIPAPFRRERISLDRHGRTWATCAVEEVAEGDMVVDVGRVARPPETRTLRETVAGIPDVAVGVKVILSGIAGNQVSYDPGSRVRAFRKAELWPGGAAGG